MPESSFASLIAGQIRTAFFGENWCGVSLRCAVEGLTLLEATQSRKDTHSIAEWVFHIDYYFEGVAAVLRGGSLQIRDQYSYEMPAVVTDEDWQAMLARTWKVAAECIELVESLPDERLGETFVDPKYGTYYRNLTGLVEHLYYHLGQIVLMKKRLAI